MDATGSISLANKLFVACWVYNARQVAGNKENNELVSATNQLKLTAAYKKYLTDAFEYEGIIELAKKLS